MVYLTQCGDYQFPRRFLSIFVLTIKAVLIIISAITPTVKTVSLFPFVVSPAPVFGGAKVVLLALVLLLVSVVSPVS